MGADTTALFLPLWGSFGTRNGKSGRSDQASGFGSLSTLRVARNRVHSRPREEKSREKGVVNLLARRRPTSTRERETVTNR